MKRLELVLSGLDDESLMVKLEKRRKHGHDDYPVRVIWNLILAMRVFQHRTIARFSTKECQYTGTDGKQHTKKETHYGFKVHVVCGT